MYRKRMAVLISSVKADTKTGRLCEMLSSFTPAPALAPAPTLAAAAFSLASAVREQQLVSAKDGKSDKAGGQAKQIKGGFRFKRETSTQSSIAQVFG